MTWQQAQRWEQKWHGNCCNDYGEMEKQLLYADRMGLKFFHNGKSPYNIDMHNVRVLDIGGGPSSLLLKCINVRGVVVDSLLIPTWVRQRYKAANIELLQQQGERLNICGFAECWLYNTLQHTEDPSLVISNARKATSLIRIFEWIDTPTNIGHPNSLSEHMLNEWLHGDGKVEQIDGIAHCYGTAYYGVFPT